jgi:hypothetical protein
MWLNGGDLAIGLGRALMRGRNAATTTILESFAWECELGLHSSFFAWLSIALAIWTVSDDAFLVDEADREFNLPLQLEDLAAPAPWKSHTMARLSAWW